MGKISILKTSIRSKHPRAYSLIDRMVTSAKILKFLLTTIYQINRGNQNSNKQKFHCFENVITQEVST